MALTLEKSTAVAEGTSTLGDSDKEDATEDAKEDAEDAKEDEAAGGAPAAAPAAAAPAGPAANVSLKAEKSLPIDAHHDDLKDKANESKREVYLKGVYKKHPNETG